MSKHRNSKPSTQRHPTTNAQPSQHCNFDPGAVYTVRMQPDANSNERYAEEKTYRAKQIRLAKALNLITAFAGGFAALYAGVSIAQWQDLRHNFVIEQRAWMQMTALFPASITEDSVVGGVVINVKNTGKSPALRSYLNGVFTIVAADKEPPFDYSGYHATSDISLLFPGGETASPVRLYETNTNSPRQLTKPELRQLIEGKAYLAFFAQIVYRDSFGIHWTRQCVWNEYSRTPTATFAADQCIAWNATGDGPAPKEIWVRAPNTF